MTSIIRQTRAPILAIAAALLAGSTACAGATSHTRLADAPTLLAERDEWRGDRTGPVVLRMHVEALVDTRPDPAKAVSGLVVHLVVAHYGVAAPIPIAFPVPRGARFTTAELRLISTSNSPGTLQAPPTSSAGGGLDPEQDTVTLTLPAPPEGGLVEAIVRFEIPGTLPADARWLGLPGLPVAELLLRYDLATSTVGAFQTTLPNARPIVTDKDGRRLIALLATNLAPLADTRSAPHARYVTVRASPKGFDQTWATDWAHATEAYRVGVVEASKPLDAGYEVPYRPVGSGRSQVLDALAWVRARPMRAAPGDPFAVRWSDARPLPGVIAANDLTAVERTHLLHWVLREAGIAHAFAMARAAARPPLDGAFPTPGVFDAPLIYVPTLDLVLDPACDGCTPGEVREALRGGQALVLPLTVGTTTASFLPL